MLKIAYLGPAASPRAGLSLRGARRAAGALLALAAGVVCCSALPAGRAWGAPSSGLASDAAPTAVVAGGTLQGVGQRGGVRAFLGIPYAAPPVGPLRWRAPQPAAGWTGVRMADHFGPTPLQIHSFPDQQFRSGGQSEDCLYLNVWTPAHSRGARLPVLVYIYGGGYVTGDGSETRYDGASMARRGIVAVTINYRLGVFGFLAHPLLTAESPYHASGNYALLDQVAALRWARANIAAFGGDPRRVTIGGESAGSFSVSALMASPLARGLFRQAIGESGSLLGLTPSPTLADAEGQGARFAARLGATTLAQMRALPAATLLQASGDDAPDARPNVDGYFLPEQPGAIYAAGRQARVALLAGWNSAEVGPDAVLQGAPPSPEALAAGERRLFGAAAGPIMAVYAGSDSQQAALAARDLSSDLFIAYGTWRWIDEQERTGGSPVYRYLYAHPLPPKAGAPPPPPPPPAAPADAAAVLPPGAPHASEIAYALGNLDLFDYYAWRADDYTVSATMQGEFAAFIKSGSPNAPGLPAWPALSAAPPRQMRIDLSSAAEPAAHRDRYEALEALAEQKPN